MANPPKNEIPGRQPAKAPEAEIRAAILAALEKNPEQPPAIAALRRRFGGSNTRLVRIRKEVLAEASADDIRATHLAQRLQVLVDQSTAAAADVGRQQVLSAQRQFDAANALAKQLDRLYAVLRERTSRADLSSIETRLDELAAAVPSQQELVALQLESAKKDGEISRLLTLLSAKRRRRRAAPAAGNRTKTPTTRKRRRPAKRKPKAKATRGGRRPARVVRKQRPRKLVVSHAKRRSRSAAKVQRRGAARRAAKPKTRRKQAKTRKTARTVKAEPRRSR